jgi:hypothetical protein
MHLARCSSLLFHARFLSKSLNHLRAAGGPPQVRSNAGRAATEGNALGGSAKRGSDHQIDFVPKRARPRRSHEWQSDHMFNV